MELLKHVWHLKQNKTDFTIKWSIVKKSIAYTGGSKRCNLCLEENRAVAKGGRRGRDTPPTKMRCRQINYLSTKLLSVGRFLLVFVQSTDAITKSRTISHI